MKNIALTISVCLLFIGCTNSQSLTVEKRILSKVYTKNNKQCSLKDLINEKWDRLYVFEPYTTERVFDNVAFPYKNSILRTGINSRDDIFVFVFFLKDKMVAQALIKNSQIDFSPVVKLDKKNHVGFFSPDQEMTWVKTTASRYKIVSIK